MPKYFVKAYVYKEIPAELEIEADSEKEARELVLVSASQSGRFNTEELQDFTVDMSYQYFETDTTT